MLYASSLSAIWVLSWSYLGDIWVLSWCLVYLNFSVVGKESHLFGISLDAYKTTGFSLDELFLDLITIFGRHTAIFITHIYGVMCKCNGKNRSDTRHLA
jgi:hypothetical protein